MPVHCTRWVLLLFLLMFPSGLRADDAEAEIPSVGRPADLPFSDASGDFRVRAGAAPTAIEAEKPFTLTLTVEAVAAVRHPPRRVDLRELANFKERFDFPEGAQGDERRPNRQTWEFVYRLQPKRADVTGVPAVPFVFFNPEIQYPRKGFQVAYTDPIPLSVVPHPSFPVSVEGPDSLFAITTGAPVEQHWDLWTAPGSAAATALLVAPPLLCAAWYLCWRRLYPDAARITRLRRSFAARRALAALRGASRLSLVQRAGRTAAVAAEYLRARFDALAEEPTPAEAADCLSRAGCSSSLAEQAATLFCACDAARFSPLTPLASEVSGESVAGPDLPAEAARFILAVEAETWSKSHS